MTSSLFRYLRRYARLIGAVLTFAFALGSAPASWACANAGQPLSMAHCHMGGSCPVNHAALCAGPAAAALPSLVSTPDIHPQWIALPPPIQTYPAASVSVDTVPVGCSGPVGPTGPPLHLRFCSFLK